MEVIKFKPSVIFCWIDFGDSPLTVHPTETAEPRTSLTVPVRFFAIDLGLMVLAISMISSSDKFPLCLTFLTFFLSLGGSLRALMINAGADATTSQIASLFWTVNLTVTFNPFQSLVAAAIWSPSFLAFKPSGPTVIQAMNYFFVCVIIFFSPTMINLKNEKLNFLWQKKNTYKLITFWTKSGWRSDFSSDCSQAD